MRAWVWVISVIAVAIVSFAAGFRLGKRAGQSISAGASSLGVAQLKETVLALRARVEQLENRRKSAPVASGQYVAGRKDYRK
ncbi:MAG: hypothetical protein LAN37_00695 [Acidobacteriia bacterium]|nr:hypothetical protein [Terriglobia bacterium]